MKCDVFIIIQIRPWYSVEQNRTVHMGSLSLPNPWGEWKRSGKTELVTIG